MKAQAVLYRPFRKTGRGVLINGEVKKNIFEAEGKPTARNLFGEGRGVLA